MQTHGAYVSRFGLDNHGLDTLKAAYWNFGPAALYEQAILRGEGHITAAGAFIAGGPSA